jgi:predicted porin
LTGPATQLTAYAVAVSVPVGAVILATNYTRTKNENAAGQGRSLGRFGVAGLYYFSKQTIAFAGLGVHTAT